MRTRAALIRVTGLVQGVGFRPFIHRLASRLGLSGYVKNMGGSEVEILLEGPEDGISAFMAALEREKPPQALLEEVAVAYVEPRGYRGFKILESEPKVTRRSEIPPDIGVCGECLREVLDPGSRWYMYPFNSCAWCGPRFSMMLKTPYDRDNTSMRDFPLCSRCRRDYEDESNERRFHAQGISCPACGPSLTLLDGDGRLMAVEDPLGQAARLLEEGHIVAVKGVGGYHLAALATRDEVVAELRRRKQRPQKPFALMALDVETVARICSPTSAHIELLQLPQRPIVLIPSREQSPVSSLVAPGLSHLGVMLPYTPLHYLLLSMTRDKFLIMTSGNRSGLPICTGEEAVRELRGIADYFLVHNRAIVNRVDDSVVRLTGSTPQILRRARGYAPRWVRLPFRLREAMALGAQLQNAGAVSFEDHVVLTQYVGDMDYLENVRFLLDALDFLERSYELRVEAVVSDMHPAYTTTRLAERLASERGVPHVTVQHHHAHVASAMASHGLPVDEAVTGIAVDGAGYGPDGTIWGGEVLAASYTEFERVGHLEPLPLPGGDRAAYYPARIAAAVLASKVGCEEALKTCVGLGLDRSLPGGLQELRLAAHSRGAPLASSAGRFLDAAAALLGVCGVRTYEGEPAMKLEAAAEGGSLVEHLRIEVEGGVALTGEFLVKLAEARGLYSVRDLAYTTQVRLGEALGLLALQEPEPRVVLSGGAAVNGFIYKGLETVVGGRILLPRMVPAGDGGLSLGQLVTASLKYLG